jgi:hypothetical protein
MTDPRSVKLRWGVETRSPDAAGPVTGCGGGGGGGGAGGGIVPPGTVTEPFMPLPWNAQ